MTTPRTALFSLVVAVNGLAACLNPLSRPPTLPDVAPSPVPAEWATVPFTGTGQRQHVGQVLAISGLPTQREDGATFVTVGSDGAVLLWNTQTGTAVRAKQLPEKPGTAALGEKKALVAWSSAQIISVACVSGCSDVWHFTGLKIKPTHLAFQGHDDALLIAGADGRVYRWAFLREKRLTTLHEKERALERYIGHQTVVSGVANHPYHRAFFSVDWDGALYGWLPYSADDHGGRYDMNLFSGRAYTDATSFVRALRAGDRGISTISVSGDGTRLALGTDEGYVEVWEVRGLTLAAKKQVHSGRVLSVALDTSGERVVSSGRDSTVTVSLLQRDREYGIKPNSSPYLLSLVSSQRLDGADKVLLLANSHIIVSTKEGLLAELSGSVASQANPEQAEPAPVVSQEPDRDYDSE